MGRLSELSNVATRPKIDIDDPEPGEATTNERRWSEGFLGKTEELTDKQIEAACEAAFKNAEDLLDEADILRSRDKCARAYFLAHIACEELGKLPILTTAAMSRRRGSEVNWKKIDEFLRSHRRKIQRVLFVDALMSQRNLRDGTELYQEDLDRLPTYLDVKNASLYSFELDGEFKRPQEVLPCALFDSFKELARRRLKAFERMFMVPVQTAGGLTEFLYGPTFDRVERLVAELTRSGRAALQTAFETGDDSPLHAFLERLLNETAEGSEESV